jgi:hypothetical protein
MHRLALAALCFVSSLASAGAATAEVLAEVPLSFAGSAGLAEGVEVVVTLYAPGGETIIAPLFDGVVWRPEDVGRTIALGTLVCGHVDPDFEAARAVLTNRENDTVEVRAWSFPDGGGQGLSTDESNFFFGDPFGLFRVDFAGSSIEEIALRLDSLSIESDGSSISNISVSVTLIVTGDPSACGDLDGDGFGSPGPYYCVLDNCPEDFNPGQADADADGLGDACDAYPTDPNPDLTECWFWHASCTASLSACENDAGQCTQDLAGAAGALQQCESALSLASSQLGQLESDFFATQEELARADAARDQALADLAEALADGDADGVRDVADACPSTTPLAAVDGLGCSQAQFCSAIPATTGRERSVCNHSDWGNDEPLADDPQDCRASAGLCGAR